jgi:hypothetical protein
MKLLEGTVAMPGKINASWHKSNKMPARATLDQRVEWHLAHQKACGCRPSFPMTIIAELKRRGIKPPAPK